MRVFYLFCVFIILLAAGAATGLYPIVFVDYTPVLTMRTWKKAEMGARNFANAGFLKAGKKSLDFNENTNSNLRVEIAKNTLIFLVEDAIIARAGNEVRDEFSEHVQEAVKNATEGKNLADSVQKIYGLTLNDFETLVLYPQARAEIVRDALGGEEQFSTWLADVKKQHRVHMIFVPYIWEDGGIK